MGVVVILLIKVNIKKVGYVVFIVGMIVIGVLVVIYVCLSIMLEIMVGDVVVKL